MAARLRELLASRGLHVEVELSSRLEEIDEVLSVMHSKGRFPGVPRLSAPLTWAAWGLPEPLVRELFAAAAGFYRAAPWEKLGEQPIRAAAPHGSWWAVSIGAAGESFGLILYDRLEDLLGLYQSGELEGAMSRLEGRCLALNFDPGHSLHKALRREVSSHGWEVAEPDAYPNLHTIGFPGGGLPRRDAEDLLALLRALPRLASFDGAGDVGSWRDPEAGVELEALLDPTAEPLIPEQLAPGGPSGAGAEPEALLAWMNDPPDVEDSWDDGPPDTDPDGLLAGFCDALRHEGLASATVRLHERNVDALLDFLYGFRVPTRALHERYLREFLFDHFPRHGTESATGVRTLRGSLRRFFAFLAEQHDIVLPFAERLLSDAESFNEACETAPPGPFWDEDVCEWRADAFDRLRAHVLVPDDRLGEDDRWGPTMGPIEARLLDELERRWLLWREELIAAGTNERSELIDRLLERQSEWEGAPHPEHAPRSPRDAVLAERAVAGETSR